jgi:hypothetical protein
MLAYDYPLLGFFWSMMILYIWIAFFFLLFRIIADIFRSHDIGGFAKALWIIFVIVLPFLGVLIYLIARGHSMAERQYSDMQEQKSQFDSYVRETAGSDEHRRQNHKLAGLKGKVSSPRPVAKKKTPDVDGW